MNAERKDSLLKIGDLARKSGKSVRALHLYEELRLLQPVSRTAGGFRLFHEEVLQRIHWIGMLQEAGMSLHQIQDLLHSWWNQADGPQAMERLRQVFAQKLEESRAQARKYEMLAGELESSIHYLETCRSCHPAPAVSACATCPMDRDAEVQPALVAGLHRHPSAGPARDSELIQIEPGPGPRVPQDQP